jgi:hypothetical protein
MFESKIILIETILNRDKKIVSQSEKVANSFVAQFIGMLYQCMILSASNLKDVNGTTRDPHYYSHWWKIVAAVNDDAYGIVIGSDATAVSINDYSLNTKIAHGTGAGQMQYSAHNIDQAYIISDPSAWYDISRTFTNNSGSPINIKEVGIYINDGSPYYFCIERTLTDKTVNDGDSVIMKYRFIKTIS